MVFLLDISPTALFPAPLLVPAINTGRPLQGPLKVSAFLVVNQAQRLKNSLKQHFDYTERHLKSMGKKLNKNRLLQCKVMFYLIKRCGFVRLNVKQMEDMSEAPGGRMSNPHLLE